MAGESHELWKEYFVSKNPAIKEQLVIENISLVRKMADKVGSYLPRHVPREDLYSNGIFGLLEAVERYNPQLGIPFNLYAGKRIKGSIIDALRREDWVPEGLRKKARLLEQAYQKVEAELNRNAADAEVAAFLNITPEELYQWLKNIQFISIISLDEPLAESEDSKMVHNIPDFTSPNPVQQAEENEVKKILARAVGELPEKEKLVVSLFYYQDMTNKEIAQIMELSDSRISQLHTKAIFRLRGKLARLKKNL